MVVTIKDLVRQYGTNLLDAPLIEGAVIRFEFYGRISQIEVTEGGRSAVFSVIG